MTPIAIFTPGPVRIPAYVLEIGAQQTPYFRNEAFSAVMLECERRLLDFAGAPPDSRAIFLAASGTGAMEAAVANLLTPGDSAPGDTAPAAIAAAAKRGARPARAEQSKRLPTWSEGALVINGGGFGQRFVDLCEHHRVAVRTHDPRGGDLSETAPLEALAPGAAALLVNAHETTTGVLYDLTALGAFCRRHDLLHVVDAISMFLTDPLDMTAQGIDALIISSHKGLALPPGLSMVLLSPRAQDRLRPGRAPYYFDFPAYVRDGARGQTPFTPTVTILLQLQARLRAVAAAGLAAELGRAERMAAYFRSAVGRWPLAFFSAHMPNAMTALTPTDGRKAGDIVADLERRYGLQVAPNGGALKDVVFRVAHMGDQTEADLDLLIRALDDYYGG